MEEPETSHTPITKVANEAILKIGLRGVQESANFLSKQKDESWKKSIDEPK